MKVKYKEYYIAFLDVLGFKNIIGTRSAADIHEMFDCIKDAKKFVEGEGRINSPFEVIEKNTFFLFFSDSIICAIPSDIPDSFEMICSHCMLIQHFLWLQKKPVWVRGAIAKGKLYCEGNEVFGPGLIEAYQMEETLAKYPRIIMTRSTYEEGIKNTKTGEDICYISDTSDGLKMLETLRYFKYDGLRAVREQIESVLGEEINDQIRQKYLWMKQYFNSCVDEKSSIEWFRTSIE